jgi:hypothetical protein
MAKRRAAPPQLSDDEQARIWEAAFSCGRDYFNYLLELGSIDTIGPLTARLRRKLGGGCAPPTTSCEPRDGFPLAVRHRGRRESSATWTGKCEPA